MDTFDNVLTAINSVIWHDFVLYTVLGVGVLFTLWSGFCQYRALTHGTAVVRGVYDNADDPGAINHFQALSAALSATVGLGNIGGVAVAIALGGPGAVFWMWMIGLAGMALKTTEVALSMMYRNTDDPDNPHGGPMWVVAKGLKERGFGSAGKFIGGVFCITLLISAITGGNMFQSWNVGIVTKNAVGGGSDGVGIATGIILAVIVGAVIIGGIKRIGAVAGRLVPLMCALYLLAAFVVLFMNLGDVPKNLALIVTSAFATQDAQGAFIGGTFGYAFLWGMKRALFSSEAGQGSSPIAHSAAKTDEPVREAVVAGLEPFIDTIVVCTLTSLVILSSGAWNRTGESMYVADALPVFVQAENDEDGNAQWKLDTTEMPGRTDEAKKVANGKDWAGTETVFIIAEFGEVQDDTANRLHRVEGEVTLEDDVPVVDWELVTADEQPVLVDGHIHNNYPGAALTTHAFDRAVPGLGTWLVLIASWLFAISTMISWSYYGEQGIVYLFGDGGVLPYKLIYCLLIVVSTLPFIETDAQLDNLTALGTGVMLWANIPIMLIFGTVAMKAYHSYMGKLKAGEFPRHKAPKLTDVVEGHDVEK
ncbi:MAG: amino acid carrier protein [Planctomycetota bacterium]